MWKTSQAIARVVRFGQLAKVVNVYFYTSNTGIEKSLFIKQQDKIACLNQLKDGPMTSTVKSLKMNEILRLIDSNENSNYIRSTY